MNWQSFSEPFRLPADPAHRRQDAAVRPRDGGWWWFHAGGAGGPDEHRQRAAGVLIRRCGCVDENVTDFSAVIFTPLPLGCPRGACPATAASDAF